jgi:hypothetical protein
MVARLYCRGVCTIAGNRHRWAAVRLAHRLAARCHVTVGFFVLVLLAWFHGERGAQRVSGTEATLLMLMLMLMLMLILLMGAGVVWLFSSKASEPANDGVGILVAEALPILSIAVLPLDNYSGDPGQDYLAEGMTDQLTVELAMISSLRVISRGSTTQFKGKQRAPTPDIARILNLVLSVFSKSEIAIHDLLR